MNAISTVVFTCMVCTGHGTSCSRRRGASRLLRGISSFFNKQMKKNSGVDGDHEVRCFTIS